MSIWINQLVRPLDFHFSQWSFRSHVLGQRRFARVRVVTYAGDIIFVEAHVDPPRIQVEWGDANHRDPEVYYPS